MTRLRTIVPVLIVIMALLAAPALAVDAPLRLALPGSPVDQGMVTGSGGILRRAFVGDDASLSRLTLGNRVTEQPPANLMSQVESSMLTFSLSDPQVYQGKTRIELGHIGGTVAFSNARPTDWVLGSARLTLSQEVEFSGANASLYDRVASQTNRLLSGRLQLAGVPLVNQVHNYSTVADSAGLQSGMMSNVAGIKLSARLTAPSETSPLLAMVDPAQAANAQRAGYDLRAEKAIKGLSLSAGYSHREGVQGIDGAYRLVDLDDIKMVAGSRNSVGVSGALAVNQVATIKAGYQFSLDGGATRPTATQANAGPDVMLTPRTSASASYQVERDTQTLASRNRASLGIGFTLADNALLKASYQLIDFGSAESAEQASAETLAAAELQIKF